MAGNVWEWTADFYRPYASRGDDPRLLRPVRAAGQPARRRHRTARSTSASPGEQFPRMVVKGGSHLCAPNYCLRYRPAARQAQTVETSMAHLGFRCIVRNAELAR